MHRNRQKTNKNPKMSHGFFTNLPPEISMDIFLRMPIESILSCKCVCKSWFNLVESNEFAQLHLSKSVLGLIIFQGKWFSKPYKILEFADEFAPQNYAQFCKVVLRFTFPYYAHIHSSVNGLLLMYDRDVFRPQILFICNPITRDYLRLPSPSPDCPFNHYTFGFGVSKTTGQYKLVMIYRVCIEFCPPVGKVYTLGTGSWRSIEVSIQLKYEGRTAAFLNGNLHWLGFDSQRNARISCFDLETELFSTFSSPNPPHNPEFSCISVLEDCLCICENYASVITVWLMKEYGNEKSWTKKFVVEKPSLSLWGFRFPVKVFEDGVVLIAEEDGPGFLCYSKKPRTVQEIVPFDTFSRTSTVFYTPSFLPVRMFAMEDVSSF